MPISAEERYKLIFQEHQFASEIRVKIITGWYTIYSALAVVFVWVYTKVPNFSCLVTAIGIAITVLMWTADYRNRTAIGRSKEVGADIEKAYGIPDKQQFFSKLEKGFSHSKAIDIFAGVFIVLLLALTVYLFRCNVCFPAQ